MSAGERPLTHLDADGRARMVDVGQKQITERTAIAGCAVVLSPETAARLTAGSLPKGDVLATARIAGIQAAKRTAELIPLCHQLALTAVQVEFEIDADTGRIGITASATAVDRTGVEMEALTAAAVAALTIYDMVKAVEREAVITELRLLHKRGGRSGDLDVRPTV
jgi:cyclic pyranopterin monophosphate synthase